MYNWYLLLFGFLALVQTNASFSERSFVNGHEDCFSHQPLATRLASYDNRHKAEPESRNIFLNRERVLHQRTRFLARTSDNNRGVADERFDIRRTRISLHGDELRSSGDTRRVLLSRKRLTPEVFIIRDNRRVVKKENTIPNRGLSLEIRQNDATRTIYDVLFTIHEREDSRTSERKNSRENSRIEQRTNREHSYETKFNAQRTRETNARRERHLRQRKDLTRSLLFVRSSINVENAQERFSEVTAIRSIPREDQLLQNGVESILRTRLLIRRGVSRRNEMTRLQRHLNNENAVVKRDDHSRVVNSNRFISEKTDRSTGSIRTSETTNKSNEEKVRTNFNNKSGERRHNLRARYQTAFRDVNQERNFRLLMNRISKDRQLRSRELNIRSNIYREESVERYVDNERKIDREEITHLYRNIYERTASERPSIERTRYMFQTSNSRRIRTSNDRAARVDRTRKMVESQIQMDATRRNSQSTDIGASRTTRNINSRSFLRLKNERISREHRVKTIQSRQRNIKVASESTIDVTRRASNMRVITELDLRVDSHARIDKLNNGNNQSSRIHHNNKNAILKDSSLGSYLSIFFYALQGIYLLSVVMELIGEKNSGKKHLG